MRRLLAIGASSAMLALSACGGGGGNGGHDPTGMKPPDVETPRRKDPKPEVTRLPFPYRPAGNHGIPSFNLKMAPTPSASDVIRKPVYADGKRLLVGTDQGPNHIGSLSVVGNRDDFNIRYGRVNDGAGHASVIGYLEQALRGGGIQKFESPPEIRFVNNAPPYLIDIVLGAVQMVNEALPRESRITIPSLRPVNPNGQFSRNGRSYHGAALARPDTIYIEFVSDLDAAGRAWTWPDKAYDGTIDHSYIRLKGQGNQLDAGQPFIFGVSLVAHELLHALGVDGHVSDAFVSVMQANVGIFHIGDQPLSILHAVDREAIQAIYSRYAPGDDPASLGPWLSSSLHLIGNGPHASFGVALRNGYAEAWASGLNPESGLTQNAALSGVVSWSGTLLGITAAARAVTGEAHIDVNLTTLHGTASFLELESWAAAPGNRGTGAMWGDGDLGYSIVVHGNTFRETGGDSGTLTGIFVGRSHEGAAGTLERDDLTAAFGATRQ